LRKKPESRPPGPAADEPESNQSPQPTRASASTTHRVDRYLLRLAIVNNFVLKPEEMVERTFRNMQQNLFYLSALPNERAGADIQGFSLLDELQKANQPRWRAG
jgi:hypothetical protein